MSLHSAIYTGDIMHVRHAPVAHRFRYPLFMLYLDLAELPDMFARRWLWSVDRRNVAAFHRGDYLGDASIPLDEAVRRRYADATGVRPSGAIRLLTHLRYFGLSFNPVSFYYCFDDTPTGEQLIGIVAESTWSDERILSMKQGDRAAVGGYAARLDGFTQSRGSNFDELAARFSITLGDRAIGTMEPSKRNFSTRSKATTEAALMTRGLSQLYISLGDVNADGSVAVRAYYKPLVLLIWLGTVVMVIGGGLSLMDRRLRVGAPKPARPAKKLQAAE